MAKADSKHLPAIPEKINRGVDELNFAEFPICLFSTNPVHIAESGKTIEFTDEIPDPINPGKTISRSVTVSGTDKYGLPTVLDDWVILGLFQMAKLQQFPKKLHFTRYHLLKLLGWGTNARDYNKLTDCLRRIQGVQFTFEKAWWDGKAKSWVSRTFNIYQDLEIYEAENSTSRPKPDVSQSSFSFACSSFEWSEFLHSNFMNRAVKGLNFHFVKSLRKPTAKRLFRFLDKRFYNKGNLHFDLHEFAEAHMGLRKGQKVGDIKRTLASAIKELETYGYLKPLSYEERFLKLRRGKYRIVFHKGDFDPTQHEQVIEENQEPTGMHAKRMIQALTERGVSAKESKRIANAYSDTIITRHLDVFDWEMEQGKNISNPGGYLRTRIKENLTEPSGFVPRALRERQAKDKKERLKQRELDFDLIDSVREEQDRKKAKLIAKFWNSLGKHDHKKAEKEALSRANNMQRDWMKKDGALKDSVIKNLMDAYAEEKLIKLNHCC